jgi:tRNA dimethylallyltransferase
VVSPRESYSAARFRTEALDLMAKITGGGRIPLLVGGTMLYFRALKGGLDELPQADPELRAEIEAQAALEGWPALHRELARVDPETAARLQPTDAQRIQRALEVCRLSGRPMSEMLAAEAPSTLPYRLLEIALMPGDRAWLHARINRRFRNMLERGLVEELRRLRQDYDLKPGLPSMRCVGYRQAWQYLEGQISEAELYEKGAAATRQLAKRQLTWLRSWQGTEVFDCMKPDLTESVSAWLARRLNAAE